MGPPPRLHHRTARDCALAQPKENDMNTDLKKALARARALVFDTPDVSIEAITLRNGRSVVVWHDGPFRFAVEPAEVIAWAETMQDAEPDKGLQSERYQSLCDATDPIEERRVARELAELHGKIISDRSCDAIYPRYIEPSADEIVDAIDVETANEAIEAGVSLLWDCGDIYGGGWMNDDEDAFAEAIAEQLHAIGEDVDEDHIRDSIVRLPYLTIPEIKAARRRCRELLEA